MATGERLRFFAYIRFFNGYLTKSWYFWFWLFSWTGLGLTIAGIVFRLRHIDANIQFEAYSLTKLCIHITYMIIYPANLSKEQLACERTLERKGWDVDGMVSICFEFLFGHDPRQWYDWETRGLLNDFLSDTGFLWALRDTLRLRKGALLWGGLPCCSYLDIEYLYNLNV